MLDGQLLPFLLAVTVLTITPGSDTMLVFRSVLTRGQVAGLLTTLGICSGLFVHATLSALGLSVILLHSAFAYSVVKWVGAGYLVYLGATTLWHARRLPAVARNATTHDTGTPREHRTVVQSFAEGALNNILNPKPAIFYLAFLPQFIAPSDPVVLMSFTLTAIHFVISVVWLSLLVVLLGRVGGWLTNPRVRQWLERATGVVLVGLGLHLALDSHS